MTEEGGKISGRKVNMQQVAPGKADGGSMRRSRLVLQRPAADRRLGDDGKPAPSTAIISDYWEKQKLTPSEGCNVTLGANNRFTCTTRNVHSRDSSALPMPYGGWGLTTPGRPLAVPWLSGCHASVLRGRITFTFSARWLFSTVNVPEADVPERIAPRLKHWSYRGKKPKRQWGEVARVISSPRGPR